jgi:hypothetical protein
VTSHALYTVTLLSASVFFLKIDLFSMALWSLGISTKVHTWLSYMDLILDFMALSHFLDSGPYIASVKVVGSTRSVDMTESTGFPNT